MIGGEIEATENDVYQPFGRVMIDDEPDPLRPVEFNACSKDLSNTRLSILLARALVRVGDGNAALDRVFHDLQDHAVIRCSYCKRDAALEAEISVADVDRTSVVHVQSVSVRVDLDGSRIIKKKQNEVMLQR